MHKIKIKTIALEIEILHETTSLHEKSVIKIKASKRIVWIIIQKIEGNRAIIEISTNIKVNKSILIINIIVEN